MILISFELENDSRIEFDKSKVVNFVLKSDSSRTGHFQNFLSSSSRANEKKIF